MQKPDKKQFKSFFDNNLDDAGQRKVVLALKNELEIVKRSVKLLTEEVNKLKRWKQEHE